MNQIIRQGEKGEALICSRIRGKEGNFFKNRKKRKQERKGERTKSER